MQILLDTHVLLWLADDVDKLSANAKKAWLEPTHDFFVSVASYWEIAIKLGLGKIALKKNAQMLLAQFCTQNGVALLPISLSHCRAVEKLPFPNPHHRDPFDRLLIAQAKSDKLTLMSADTAFAPYHLRVLW